jgi:hypothetical protein
MSEISNGAGKPDWAHPHLEKMPITLARWYAPGEGGHEADIPKTLPPKLAKSSPAGDGLTVSEEPDQTGKYGSGGDMGLFKNH